MRRFRTIGYLKRMPCRNSFLIFTYQRFNDIKRNQCPVEQKGLNGALQYIIIMNKFYSSSISSAEVTLPSYFESSELSRNRPSRVDPWPTIFRLASLAAQKARKLRVGRQVAESHISPPQLSMTSSPGRTRRIEGAPSHATHAGCWPYESFAKRNAGLNQEYPPAQFVFCN